MMERTSPHELLPHGHGRPASPRRTCRPGCVPAMCSREPISIPLAARSISIRRTPSSTDFFRVSAAMTRVLVTSGSPAARASWRTLKVIGSNLLGHPQIRGLVLILHDITDRKRMEQELGQLHRLTSLGRLSAQVAHEFNNVMMGIQPIVEAIRRRAHSDPTLLHFTDIITPRSNAAKRSPRTFSVSAARRRSRRGRSPSRSSCSRRRTRSVPCSPRRSSSRS